MRYTRYAGGKLNETESCGVDLYILIRSTRRVNNSNLLNLVWTSAYCFEVFKFPLYSSLICYGQKDEFVQIVAFDIIIDAQSLILTLNLIFFQILLKFIICLTNRNFLFHSWLNNIATVRVRICLSHQIDIVRCVYKFIIILGQFIVFVQDWYSSLRYSLKKELILSFY